MTYVYRHYSAANEVLYIGCCALLVERHFMHRARSPWWPDVAYVTALPAEHEDAYRYEAQLIRYYQPPFNIEHTERDARPGRRRARTIEEPATPAPWYAPHDRPERLGRELHHVNHGLVGTVAPSRLVSA